MIDMQPQVSAAYMLNMAFDLVVKVSMAFGIVASLISFTSAGSMSGTLR